MRVKEFDLENHDTELRLDDTEKINTVNRQKSTIKMNEISAQKPDSILKKKYLDASKISP
jgi:hypothetical protein